MVRGGWSAGRLLLRDQNTPAFGRLCQVHEAARVKRMPQPRLLAGGIASFRRFVQSARFVGFPVMPAMAGCRSNRPVFAELVGAGRVKAGGWWKCAAGGADAGSPSYDGWRSISLRRLLLTG